MYHRLKEVLRKTRIGALPWRDVVERTALRSLYRIRLLSPEVALQDTLRRCSTLSRPRCANALECRSDMSEGMNAMPVLKQGITAMAQTLHRTLW